MLLFLIFFSLFLFIGTAQPSHAYLDPGTGSFVFQMIVGAILGGLFTIKLYFKKIKNFLKQAFVKTDEEKDDKKHAK